MILAYMCAAIFTVGKLREAVSQEDTIFSIIFLGFLIFELFWIFNYLSVHNKLTKNNL